MIKTIIELLNADHWYGHSEEIDIAKGKYALVSSFKGVKESVKRHRYGRGNSN
jgi:hypothetical protein